jgi:hypothetical protein
MHRFNVKPGNFRAFPTTASAGEKWKIIIAKLENNFETRVALPVNLYNIYLAELLQIKYAGKIYE